MSELKLKCCPFCGNPARVVLDYQDIERWAQCTKRKPERCVLSTAIIEIAKWNRRAQPEANADAKDAERYRHLRELMQFSTPPGRPTTMKLRAALPAPEHQPHRDWMGEYFDASVDRTVDADIRACLTAEEIPAFDASRQSKEKGND